MKKYVSDKYNETLKNKTIIHTPRGCGKEFENYLKIVKEFKKNNQNFIFVFSERNLEQHEEEIKKPLIDAIVKLNEFISRLISEKEPETAREITERHHREIMLERKNKFLEEEIERLKKENKQLIKDNSLLDKTKYTAQQDDIDFFVEQERLKVITELEEWLDKQPTATYWLNNNEGEEHLSAENIKQKLKEMKEVRDERK